MSEQPQNPQELAALELYHQLVNLSPDDGDIALRLTVRLPNGNYVGDVLLSMQDVERLTDAAIQIVVHQEWDRQDQPAAPLDADDSVTDDEVADVFAGFEALLNGEDGQR